MRDLIVGYKDLTRRASNLAGWPRFTVQKREVLQLMRNNITVIADGEDLVRCL